jgi:hypothetical protein
MAQRLNDIARPASFEMAQREFNEWQMLPLQPAQPQPPMQQQQQIQQKKKKNSLVR